MKKIFVLILFLLPMSLLAQMVPVTVFTEFEFEGRTFQIENNFTKEDGSKYKIILYNGHFILTDDEYPSFRLVKCTAIFKPKFGSTIHGTLFLEITKESELGDLLMRIKSDEDILIISFPGLDRHKFKDNIATIKLLP